MKALIYLVLATAALTLVCWTAVSEACSCVGGRIGSRDEAIRFFFRNSKNIYTATVVRANCKCYKTRSDQTNGLLSCLEYSLDTQGTVQRNISREYTCRQGFGFMFPTCSSAVNQTARNRSVAPVHPGSMPPVNTTGQMRCGVSNYGSESAGQGCNLTPQPCYYIATVGQVFKGNFSRGQTLSVSGPDVLTSCGNVGRVLSLGTDYLAGIGGPCYSISSWEDTSMYSSNEMQLLRELQNECAMNPTSSVCSGTGPVAAYMGTGLLSVLLTVAIALVVGSH